MDAPSKTDQPTREQILSAPSDLLNEWVAKHVLKLKVVEGWVFTRVQVPCPDAGNLGCLVVHWGEAPSRPLLYATDPAAAFGRLLAYMTSEGWRWECGDTDADEAYAKFWRPDSVTHRASAALEAPALALTRAALLAIVTERR